MADFDQDETWVELTEELIDKTPEQLAVALIEMVRTDRTLLIQRGEDPELALKGSLTTILTLWGQSCARQALATLVNVEARERKTDG